MSLFEELKRRRVFRVAGAYLVAAWIMLQVSATLFPALHLPGWTVTLVAVIVVVGFPVALLMGWAFDLTPGGLERAAGGIKFPLRSAGIATVIVALGVSAFVFVRYSRSGGVNDRSIAVLPFANMSTDQSDAFFADGVQDEILTHLARIAALDVRSRTSVLEYRNTTKNLKQIAQELSVRYILEGSVRRSGDNTRITAQLIDAHTDKHVWANTYDGTRADVFGMQTSVAENIAKELEAELTPAERSRLAAKPTENADAHDLYLQALDYSKRSQDPSDLRAALSLARKAVELDPKYADAHALQAEMLSQLYWFHFDRSDSIQAAAKQAAERALELDPALPEGHFANGEYLYRVKLDYNAAQKEIRRALEAAPGDARYVFTLAAILRRQGNMNDAVTQMERSVKLDPRSSVAVQNLGETYHLLHRVDDAARTFDRAIELLPTDLNVIVSSLVLELNQTGDVVRARRLAGLLDQTKGTPAERAVSKARVELLDRKPDAVIALLQSIPDTVDQTQFFFMPNSLMLGLAYELKGDARAARAFFTRALNTIDATQKSLPDDPRLSIARALALSGLGQKQQAIAAAEHATALMPMSRDWWRGSRTQRGLAIVYGRTGEPDKAIAILQKLLTIPSDVGRGALRQDPLFDPLRNHPRFQDLLR